MEEMYFTIAGCNHYYGTEFMEKVLFSTLNDASFFTLNDANAA